MMRNLKRLLTGVCMAAVLAATAGPAGMAEVNASGIGDKAQEVAEAGTASRAAGGIVVKSEENRVPTFKAGEAKVWKLTIHNNSEEALTNVVIAPKLGEKNDEWPFRTEYQSYEKSVENIAPGESAAVEFEFVQRDDVATSRHIIQFDVSSDQELASQRFYVNTTVKPEEKPNPPADNNPVQDPDTNTGTNTPSPGDGMDFVSSDAGGFSNGGVSGGGSDAGASSGSVPRVIVTGFSTDPAEVRAGSNFTLTIHLRNTSKASKVSNMLFDLSAPTEGSDEQTVAPAFLPSSGSSSIYLDGIKANGTADISIQLNAKADLLQKPYSVELSMKYEDKDGASVDAASSLSIPVKQDARFEFSDFEINPDSISVGDEANVMCNLYNLGRIKLYNVKAIFEGTCIKKEEVFLGNVESGTSASIDAMLEGAQATEGPAKVTMTVSYEDEAGTISTTTKDLQLTVMEGMESDMMMTDMEMIEEEKSFPVLPVAVIAAVVVVVIVAAVVIKKRKKRQRQNEEEELLDELDRPSEDER